jgi:hypothetical protein
MANFYDKDKEEFIDAIPATIATKMWVIKGSRGEYDDFSEWNVCLCTCLKSAEEAINDMYKVDENWNESNDYSIEELDIYYGGR